MREFKILEIKQGVFDDNNKQADGLREDLKKRGTFLLNLMSSPGSGKTTTLVKTIRALKETVKIGVMEADIDSDVDAVTIGQEDVKVIQLHTGGMCHLDAEMTRQGLHGLGMDDLDLVILENVGNLVCPAMFDLGEAMKVVIVSPTEGDDKPLKYPYMFQEAHICIINKVDLAPYLDTDIAKLRENALKVNHHLRFFEVSATKGIGMDEWCGWLLEASK